MIGLKQVRATAADVSEKLAETAADTRAAVLGAVALGGLALAVAVIALVISVKARHA